MLRKFLGTMMVSTLGLVALAPVAAHAGVVTVNFDAIDTSGGSVTGPVLDTYLAGFGITLANMTANTSVSVATPPTADTNVVLTSNPNYLSQWWNGINGTSFDFKFGTILQALSITIPQITPGVVVPAWSLTAFDSANASLGSFSGGIAGSPFPARTFTFTGPIASLRVFSNVQGFAGMGGIPIDDLTLTVPEPVPEPGTLALFSLGLAGLGFIRRKKSA